VFDRFRNLNLAKPKINVEVDGNCIKLRSDVPAFGVFIETENEVDLSDNCLNMEPGKPYEVYCSGVPGSTSAVDLAHMMSRID